MEIVLLVEFAPKFEIENERPSALPRMLKVRVVTLSRSSTDSANPRVFLRSALIKVCRTKIGSTNTAPTINHSTPTRIPWLSPDQFYILQCVAFKKIIRFYFSALANNELYLKNESISEMSLIKK